MPDPTMRMKKWGGLLKEVCTDYDNFVTEFLDQSWIKCDGKVSPACCLIFDWLYVFWSVKNIFLLEFAQGEKKMIILIFI